MSAAPAVKWVVRRYQPARYSAMQSSGAQSLAPKGHSEQTYAEWRDVCIVADTILGDNCLEMGCPADVPVVFQQGEDVVLIYMKLDF